MKYIGSLVCMFLGSHKVKTCPGPVPGKQTPSMWTVKWHYYCKRCKARW